MREILQKYREAVEEFNRICQDIKEQELDLALAPGKWTISEQIIHVVDCEIVGMYRMRKAIAEDKPLLMVFDQDAWVDKLNYSGLSPRDAGSLLKAMHLYNSVLLSNSSPKQCEKIAIHEEKGKITVCDIVKHHAQHVTNHVENIKKILAKTRG